MGLALFRGVCKCGNDLSAPVRRSNATQRVPMGNMVVGKGETKLLVVSYWRVPP